MLVVYNPDSLAITTQGETQAGHTPKSLICVLFMVRSRSHRGLNLISPQVLTSTRYFMWDIFLGIWRKRENLRVMLLPVECGRNFPYHVWQALTMLVSRGRQSQLTSPTPTQCFWSLVQFSCPPYSRRMFAFTPKDDL